GRSAHDAPELPLDGSQVAPHVLPGDTAIAQLEHVQEAEADRPALAIAEEHVAIPDISVPDRLVDQEILAVEPTHRRDALSIQGGEQHLVERPDLRRVLERADRGRNDFVLGTVGQAAHDPIDVIGRLEGEVLVDELVHLLASHAHRSCLLRYTLRDLSRREICLTSPSY